MQDECIHSALLQGRMSADEEFGAGGECWQVHTFLPDAEGFFVCEASEVRGHQGVHASRPDGDGVCWAALPRRNELEPALGATGGRAPPASSPASRTRAGARARLRNTA